MVSGQSMLSILRRKLFINTCTFLMMVVVVLQVSTPYSRTVLTFVLKILTLMLVDRCFEFHMFFNCRNAAIALPTLTFTSASDPPCSSMVLPHLSVSRSRVVGLVFSVLYLKVLLFPLSMLRPTDAEAAATLVVFICIRVYGIGGLGRLQSPNRLIDSELSIVFRASRQMWRSL
ncbi:unnamed protein product [Schistosoma curassoni]|uniref:Secreted protein n=1 Tax=Schistosoma curassoni TaxID=6186 RepID=A0A183K8K5_9TREM|nr:unnamed protein product [Schistosoma curassoni]